MGTGWGGLFEIDPAEKQRQGRPLGVDKRFGAFDPHQILLLHPSPRDYAA